MDEQTAAWLLVLVAFGAGWAGGYMHGMETMHVSWLKRRRRR